MSFPHRLVRYALLVLAWVLAGTPAQAADKMGIGDPITMCVARAMPGQRVADLFAGRIPLDCKTPQNRLGGGDYWVLGNRVERHGEVALRSVSLWQQARTVYARYADGVIVAKRSDARQASANLQLGAIFLDRLPARDAPLVQVAWKVEGAANLRGIVVGPRLATLRESGWANLYMAAIYAGFAGLCIALLVHHFALWTAMQHRFQLAYCVMVGLLLGYAFTSSGAIAWAFPGFDNNDRLRLNYIGLGLSATAAISFARAFFEETVFEGWIGRAGTAVAFAILASSTSYALLAPWNIMVLDKAFAMAFLMLVAFVPMVMVRAWRRRSSYLWLFAIAWAAPVVFAGLRVANNFSFIGWSFWIDNSTILSMSAEALLSSVGITYRIRLLSRERDEARVQELAARALADADPLTGLLNRRAFLHRAIGREGDQTLFVIDLDHFKAVNETIGHDGGDEVLRVFARGLRGGVPSGALVARIGGEEFAVVMPVGRAIDPNDLLAHLRRERMPFDMNVTASIGVCSGSLATESDWKNLYRRADRALYDAKADGRDRVRIDVPSAA